MMAIDASAQQVLTKCSRLKARDYRHHPRHAIDDLEQLIATLEARRAGVRPPLQSIVDIIQGIIASVDRTTLWNPKGKSFDRQLAWTACRLFQCLCQFDADFAASEEVLTIMRSFLQWLKDDTDFCLTKSVSQELHIAIYACIEKYALICRNPGDFLKELFSTSSAQKSQSSSLVSCFTFHHRRKSSNHGPLSIVDYSARLVIYLLESSLVTSSLLINQILTVFLRYASFARFSVYLVNHTDFYRLIIEPLLSTKNTDYFVQCVLDETARSQTDSTERVFVFTHMLNLLGEFVLHRGIEIHSCGFASTFKHLFDSLVECGTTVPLWYLVRCLSNLLTSADAETNLLCQELHRLGFIHSLVSFTSTLLRKSTLGEGQMQLKPLHHQVLASCLSILYNISTLDHQLLDLDVIINQLCRPLFKSDAQQVRLISCLLYANLLTQTELESDSACHHLCEQLFASIRQAFLSPNHHLSNQISLFSLAACLKKLCTHKQFQIRIGQVDEHIELLFEILRQFHSSVEQQEETQAILESLWFLSFETSCATRIHSHDKYFALLVQLAETNPNEMVQQAAKGILWQLRQTMSASSTLSEPIVPDTSQHIMFSYNHDAKELVQKICQSLRNAGYRTWMDIDDMHGSTLDCMAHAVEQSCVLIICMSEKYKQSPNCQSEAEYAYRLKKPFVPILLQAKFKPDGWLGMLLGTKLYVDFTKSDFDSNYQKLVKEIETARK